MGLSRTIMQNFKAEAANHVGAKKDISYFIDVTELWEIYLLKLLQNNISAEYRVYSPNAFSGAKLLDDSIREIRPDILIERDGEVVMIIDAKYKNYCRLGSTAKYGVSREDLYQMSTYLYHYGKEEKRAIGVFTSPVECFEQRLHTFTENQRHQIGLINLAIDTADSIEQIHQIEDAYIKNVQQLLNSL